MTLRRAFAAAVLALALALFPGPRALAQYGAQPGGMMPGMPPPRPGAGQDATEEGPAEKAPDDGDDAQPGDLEPLGAYREDRHRTQVIELDGYLRLRGDWLHNLNLGQGYVTAGDPSAGPPPFPTPLECSFNGVKQGGCGTNSLASGNLRLRLEPIVNVTDQVRVLAQIDVLDNTIMGSTPDTLARYGLIAAGQHPALYTTQDPPEVGRNSVVSSMRAKRAWGEVDSEFGSLKFGRMPWHWGRGMFFNKGNCFDCDGGTTVDRIVAQTKMYGHDLALAWDFGSQGANFATTQLGMSDPEGPPLDLSQNDDTLQWMASISKRDDEDDFRSQAARGDLAVNYGFQLVYRKLGRALYPTVDSKDSPVDHNGIVSVPSTQTGFTNEQLARNLQATDALIFIPDLWFKLGWKALTVEFEGAAVLGNIGNAGPLVVDSNPKNQSLGVRQYGWVLASDLALFKNAFFVGFETGGASGDQAENPHSYLNYRWHTVQQPIGDKTITDFKFSPEYHVDQILFRRILGTVTNAIYFKPQLAYWLNLAETRQLGITAAMLYSIADVPVSTPGNQRSYGIEMDLGLTYRNPAGGFYAGMTWGVLWPLGALDRPGPTGGADKLWDRGEDSTAAQVLRTFFGIRF